MADKKMNDFSVASTGEYIYAESASGEQIKISKADLASVVAELQGIKYGAFSLSYGETKELVLGAGFLFLWDWAAQYYGLIEISYWSDTVSIRYGNITNSTSIEKSSSSKTIKMACKLSNYTCNLKYVFIGL